MSFSSHPRKSAREHDDSANRPVNLFGLDRRAMTEFFTGIDEKPFRTSQVLKWIYQHGVIDFSEMTNLSLLLRDKLPSIASLELPEVVSDQVSADGTHKWLIRLDSGNSIETVFIPEKDRGTLCVSSQIGCPLDCSFCSTGKQGFNRNLDVAEIIAQVWIATDTLGYHKDKSKRISNIVLMGMGEPLLNYDNVSGAVNLMLDDCAYGLSRKRVTLSTAGVVPGIRKLATGANISLAISLHAPTDELRDVLVPLNRKYPVRELMAAIRDYCRQKPGETVTFEYVMLDGVNDSEQYARTLAKLLGDIPAKVNLIPFNPFPGTEYRRSNPEAIDSFREILLNAGIITITRKTRGDDIDAACGQLAGKVIPRARRHRENLSTGTL